MQGIDECVVIEIHEPCVTIASGRGTNKHVSVGVQVGPLLIPPTGRREEPLLRSRNEHPAARRKGN